MYDINREIEEQFAVYGCSDIEIEEYTNDLYGLEVEFLALCTVVDPLDAYNAITNGNFRIIPDVDNNNDLGWVLFNNIYPDLPLGVQEYLDCEKFARDYQYNVIGCFFDDGWIEITD